MKRASPVRHAVSVLFLALAVMAWGQTPAVYAQDTADNNPIKAELGKQLQLIDHYTLDLPELASLYQARAYKPAWRTASESDQKALASFVDTMEAFAKAHGLANDHAPAEVLRKLLAKPAEENATKLELLISDWLIKLAHDLYGDKIELSELYVGWSFKRPHHQLIAELAAAIRDGKTNEFLTNLAPVSADYVRLSEALKTYRALKVNGPWPQIPLGATIKPDTTDPRVPLVRARLAAEGYNVPVVAEGEDPAFYSDGLKQAVIEYQSRNGLEADGSIGGKTVNAMDVPLVRRIEQIIANMERLRHMPRSYPDRYAIVNIANASLQIIENGAVVYEAPVVVGRPDRKTPFIQSAIRSVIFNPSWHVPAKIAREDILPKLRKDPHYLEKMGMVVRTDDDEADPSGANIDWKSLQDSAALFHLRQVPGEQNSLGRIKFDFDNNFSVYMHGTPHEELFAKAARNLSSGCIRLKEPEEVAKVVLEYNDGTWDLPDIQREVDKTKTRWMKVAKPLPLYVVYQTAFFPTVDSSINFRTDVYNYDRILTDALKEKAD